MSKNTLDLGGTVKRPATNTQRGAAEPAAAPLVKALTVKVTAEEYKALRTYALEHEMSHQDIIRAALLEKIGF